jgi:hypothetical protein
MLSTAAYALCRQLGELDAVNREFVLLSPLLQQAVRTFLAKAEPSAAQRFKEQVGASFRHASSDSSDFAA